MLKRMTDELFNSAENNDYKKIINIGSWIYMLIAPSYLWLCFYKVDFFKSVDTIKLLILCVSINAFFIFFILILIYTYLEIKNKCRSNKLNKNLFEEATIRLKSIIMIYTIVIIVYRVFYI